MNTASHTESSSPPKRRLLQHRLGALFFFVGCLALLLTVLGLYFRKRTERRVVAELRALNCLVMYDYEWDPATNQSTAGTAPVGPAWVRRLCGDDVFAHPTRLFFGPGPGKPDKALEKAGQLSSLASVQVFNLSAASEPFKALSTLSRLKRLALDGPIDFHDLESISPRLSVAKLELSRQSLCLRDSVCTLIVEKFPGLTELDIQGGVIPSRGLPELSDKGLSEFRRLPHLAKLSVKGFPIVSTGGITDLSGFPSLKELRVEIRLDLSSTAHAVERVRIDDCPALERIQITPFDSFDWDGAHWLGVSLKRVPKLEELSVEKARELAIDDSGHLEKLVLGNDCDIGAGDFSTIVAHAPLREVDFDFFDGDLASALENLKNASSLRKLVAWSSGLTWNGNPAGIGWPGIATQVGQLKQVEELELESTGPERFDDRCLRKLEQLQNLRSLTLYGTGVSDEGIKRIRKAIPGLSCNVGRPAGSRGNDPN